MKRDSHAGLNPDIKAALVNLASAIVGHKIVPIMLNQAGDLIGKESSSKVAIIEWPLLSPHFTQQDLNGIEAYLSGSRIRVARFDKEKQSIVFSGSNNVRRYVQEFCYRIDNEVAFASQQSAKRKREQIDNKKEAQQASSKNVETIPASKKNRTEYEAVFSGTQQALGVGSVAATKLEDIFVPHIDAVPEDATNPPMVSLYPSANAQFFSLWARDNRSFGLSPGQMPLDPEGSEDAMTVVPPTPAQSPTNYGGVAFFSDLDTSFPYAEFLSADDQHDADLLRSDFLPYLGSDNS